MKNLIGILLACIIFNSSVFAGNYTWTGTTNSNWDASSNWSPAGIPGSSDTININSTTNSLTLTANQTVKRLTMNSGILDLGGDTLTITGSSGLHGGNINNGHFKTQTSGLIYFHGTNFGAEVSAVGQIKLDGSVFDSTAYFEHNSSASGTGAGGNTFNGVTTLKNAGTTTFRTAGTNSDTFNNNVFLISASSAGSSNFQMSYGAATYFNGNIEVTSSSTFGISFSSAGNGSSTLANGKTITIGSGGFTGTLLIKNFTQTGSTAQSLSLTGVLNIANSTFNGSFTSSSSSILLSGCNFNNQASFTKTGTANDFSAGGNYFANTTTFTNSSSTTAKIRLAATSGDSFGGDVTFNTSNGLIEVAYTDTSEFHGDVSINNSKVTFNNSSGFLMFTGATSQQIDGSADYKIGKLIVNKTTNGVTLERAVTIDSILTFTNGIIYTDTINLVTLKAGSICNGASSLSYVEGPIKKIGNTSFIFPVGKSHRIGFIEMSSPSNITDSYIAEYFTGIQNIGDRTEENIGNLSGCGFWFFKQKTGSSSLKLKFSLENDYCNFLFNDSVKIAVNSDSLWKKVLVDSIEINSNIIKLITANELSNFGWFSILSISGGLVHAGAICNQGKVNIWGAVNYGQHGDCSPAALLTPWPTFVLHNPNTNTYSTNFCTVPYNFGQLEGIKKLSTGWNYNIALKCDGSVVSWGENGLKQLGVPLLNNGIFSLICPAAVTVPLNNIIDVSAGAIMSYAVSSNGQGFYWGLSNICFADPFCTPTIALSSASVQVITYSTSQVVDNFVQISAGARHAAGVLRNGKVVSWGKNDLGQLGLGNTTYSTTNAFPQDVKVNASNPILGIKFVSSGGGHTLALDVNGDVWAWGTNNKGQLGNVVLTPQTYANKIIGLDNIISISSGLEHSCALRTNPISGVNEVYCWGSDEFSQTGIGTNTPSVIHTSPQLVSFPINTKIVAIEAGQYFNLAYTDDNRIFGWGQADFFVLARNQNTFPSFQTITYGGQPYKVQAIPMELTNYIPGLNETAICNPINSCDNGVNYCYSNLEINSSQNWSSTFLPVCFSNDFLYIQNELKIKAGKTLTVSSGITLFFGPNGRIVLEEGNSSTNGAQLILESGSVLTAAGDCMWKGIEVRGNNQYPSNSTRQAKIIVEPGALIEHAHNAVLLGKWNSQYYNNCSDPIWTVGQNPYVLNGSGGVIDCQDATFQNNAIDIRFAPFSKFVNFSKILNSAIHNSSGFLGGPLRDKRYLLTGFPLHLTSPYFASPNSLQRASISIYNLNNNGIQIEGNTFSDYNTGIYAVDARNLRIESCLFDNQVYGIRSEFTNSTVKHPGIFIDNSFIDVGGQIYLKGGRNDVIRTNQFNFDNVTSGTQTDNFVGVYLNNSIGYRIVDNDFYELTYGILGINSGRNFGSLIGYETKGNIFNTTRYAVGMRYNNAGLQIRCNTYNNPNALKYDKNWFIGNGSPMSDQGMQSSADERLPAGNLFATSNRKDIFSASNNLLFTYFRHGGLSTLPIAPSPSGPINVDATSITFSSLEIACTPEPPCDPPCEMMDLIAIKNSIDTLVDRKEILLTNLDNQYQDALINFLQSPYSKDSLLNFLLNSSPLSDTIISLAINSVDSLPDANLELVLAVNSPLSTASLQYLDARSPAFDEQSYERIISLQGYNSPYETVSLLENRIKSLWNNYHLISNDYFRRLAEQDSIPVIIDFLKGSGTTYSLEQVFSIYLANDELDSAAVLFDQISIREDVESDWLTLNGILLDISIQEKSLFEMDSTQLSYIEGIAFQEAESPSKANAESILTLLTWVDFEYSLPEENGNRLNGSSYGTSNNSKFELLKITPNPANNEVIISGYSNSIKSLEIRDISSKIIDIETIQNINGNIKMNVSKLNPGIYFVKIVDQNNNIKVGKFMVAR